VSAPRVLLTGLAFPESPRWYDGALWLADWGAHTVLRLDTAGNAEVVAEVPSFPLCFDHLPDGRLLAVDSPRGRLLRQEPDGDLVPHASLAELSPYPWNEVVVDGEGYAFVNGIGFDFPAGTPGPGLVVVAAPDGTARQVAGDLAFPNGMALTPTGELLVAESYAGRITAFDVAPDRSLTNRRVWADLGDAAPDGICVDAEGAVWFADVPHQQCVRVRAGGQVVETVPLDRGAFSCALSGSALYITANDWRGPTAEHTGNGQVLVVDVAVGRA
jgi:sugar lactone lactonase YvrE